MYEAAVDKVTPLQFYIKLQLFSYTTEKSEITIDTILLSFILLQVDLVLLKRDTDIRQDTLGLYIICKCMYLICENIVIANTCVVIYNSIKFINENMQMRL